MILFRTLGASEHLVGSSFKVVVDDRGEDTTVLGQGMHMPIEEHLLALVAIQMHKGFSQEAGAHTEHLHLHPFSCKRYNGLTQSISASPMPGSSGIMDSCAVVHKLLLRAFRMVFLSCPVSLEISRILFFYSFCSKF